MSFYTLLIVEKDYDAADQICRRTQNEADFLSAIDVQLKVSPPPNENHLTRFVTPIGEAQISTDKAISMYKLFLQVRWNMNSRMKYQGDALYQAIGRDNQTLVRWILNNGADSRVNDDFMEYTQL
ncbi:hypothetical protein BJ165DRAFT_1531624 [Panaeolus papilionaceus]|nr:hypothetical protein BJ165DRAFT_1531624 [Panaeolus papilionaceus]